MVSFVFREQRSHFFPEFIADLPLVTCHTSLRNCHYLLTDNSFWDRFLGNDSNLLIVFYVQIMPDDFVMQLHRF
ncbi:hypothetical protein AM365_14435 [Escherichia coli]|nr:hypothetical protein AM365_14435 [Escherichia coli]ARW94815.1 hypothetical protein AM366_02780 [Escherichia coli]ARX58733.1 hypothetical protein AM375_03900 [Escherichia coli]